MAGEGRESVRLLAQIRDVLSKMQNAQQTLRQTAPAMATGGFGSGMGAVARARGRTGGRPGGGAMGGFSPAAIGAQALGSVARAVQPFAEAGLDQSVQGGQFSGGVANRAMQALDESSLGQIVTTFAGGGLGRDIRVGRRAGSAAAGRLSEITGTVAAMGGNVSRQERQAVANVFLEQERRRANEQVEVENLFGSRDMLEKSMGRKGALTEGSIGSFFDNLDSFFEKLTGSVSKGVRDGLGSGGR